LDHNFIFYLAEDKTWVVIDETNTPPNKPILKGPTNIKNGTLYEYTFYAIDTDGDDVYYYQNWGDTFWARWWEGWIGPYKSGEELLLENIWNEKGNYTVRVKAKDKYEAKSDWAILKLKISKNKESTRDLSFKNFFDFNLHYFPIIKLLIRILGQ